MRYLSAILILFIVSSGLISCGEADTAEVQDIVIVGGDTLGRNWDNLATAEEAEQAKALGISPEQYVQMKEQEQLRIWQESQAANSLNTTEDLTQGGEEEEDYYNFEPTKFSEKMHKEQTYTVMSADGREVVVGSQDQGKLP